jgi:hypothetical protein
LGPCTHFLDFPPGKTPVPRFLRQSSGASFRSKCGNFVCPAKSTICRKHSKCCHMKWIRNLLELTLTGISECPQTRLKETEAQSCGLVWVVPRVGKTVQALKLLDLAASARRIEGSNQGSEPCPKSWATQNAVHEPAVPARMSVAKLVLDEGLLSAAFLAAKIEVLFPVTIGSDELPSLRHAIPCGIAPPFAVVHSDQYRKSRRSRGRPLRGLRLSLSRSQSPHPDRTV